MMRMVYMEVSCHHTNFMFGDWQHTTYITMVVQCRETG